MIWHKLDHGGEVQGVQTLMARLELHATASAWPVALASGNLSAGVLLA